MGPAKEAQALINRADDICARVGARRCDRWVYDDHRAIDFISVGRALLEDRRKSLMAGKNRLNGTDVFQIRKERGCRVKHGSSQRLRNQRYGPAALPHSSAKRTGVAPYFPCRFQEEARSLWRRLRIR